MRIHFHGLGQASGSFAAWLIKPQTKNTIKNKFLSHTNNFKQLRASQTCLVWYLLCFSSVCSPILSELASTFLQLLFYLCKNSAVA